MKDCARTPTAMSRRGGFKLAAAGLAAAAPLGSATGAATLAAPVRFHA